MEVIVEGKGIKGGEIIAPPSKSYSHRAIINASCSSETSKIINPLFSKDVESTIRGCRALGSDINQKNNFLEINGFGKNPSVPDDVVDLGNSGTSLRFLLSIASLIEEGSVVFTGDRSLRSRPNQPLIDALNELGANVFSKRNNGSLPIVVEGKIKGGVIELNAEISSQFISSLLTALPLCEKDSVIKPIGSIKSKPYIEMTLEVLAKSGIEISNKYRVPGQQSFNAINFRVPGDFSSASNLLVLGALSNKVEIKNLAKSSLQGDFRILEILSESGAMVERKRNKWIVSPNELNGFEVDLSNNPDLFPILAVFGSFIENEVKLVNISHIRYKETDRVHAMRKELEKMGIETEVRNGSFLVKGSNPSGAELDGYGDHRVVMALTIAALNAKGKTKISDAESVGISYPNFFGHIKKLGGEISLR